MSRDAGERLPPRRPKPGSKRPAEADPAVAREEPSTWRPNTGPSAGGSRSGSGSRPAVPGPEEGLTEAAERGPGWGERLVFGRVGSGQLSLYSRQFAAYLDAGVDLLKALSSLERQFARTALGPVTGRLLLAVRRGDGLAESMAREPQAFDALYLSMIKVAEARGGVPEALRLLARHYEARQNLIRQARSAMIYPIAVLTIAGGVIALLTIWLLPKFIEMLRDVAPRAPLPLPSRLLMAFSDFVQAIGWWLIPLLLIAIPVAAFRLYRTRGGKRLMDELALWVPVLGTLLLKIDTTRFARTLASLLGAGVDVGTSLALTADVLQLDPLRRAVRDARAEVLQGTELSAGLASSRRFGPDVMAVISSGEETGRLPETLDKLADDYQEQVAYMVRNMGQLIQPLLLIVLGGIVLFIALALLLPYVSLLTNLSR